MSAHMEIKMPKRKTHDHAAAVPASPAIPRLCLSVPEVAESTSLSKSTLYNCMKEGRLKFIKAGSRRLIPMTELQAFLSALAVEYGAA